MVNKRLIGTWAKIVSREFFSVEYYLFSVVVRTADEKKGRVGMIFGKADKLIRQRDVGYVFIYQMEIYKFRVFYRSEVAFAENLGCDSVCLMKCSCHAVAVQISTEKHGNNLFVLQLPKPPFWVNIFI